MDKSKNTPLSASRIKTLQTCSWIYYCKYILRLPDESNHGSLRGTVCHNVFECLGNPRHKKHYDKIIESQDSFASPVVERYVRAYAKKYAIDDFENIDSVNSMILAGLSYDFFSKKHGEPLESISEKDFDIEVSDGEKNYRVLGFIDKLFLFKKASTALIRDFKSSKSVFSGNDLTDNIQHLIYCLAVKHLYPEYAKRDMEFLFLKFDMNKEGVIEMDVVDDDELEGVEYFLTEIQEIINNFDDKAARSAFAYDKGFPKQEEGFCGKIVCGRATHKGQLKKDGSLMWHCKFKFKQDFWQLKDKDGKIIKSAFLDDKKSLMELKKKHAKSKIEKYSYGGCPKFAKKEVDMSDPFL